MTLLLVLIGWVAWMVVGCLVLAQVDSELELLQWVERGPVGAFAIVLTLWPVVLYWWLRR